MRLRGLPALGTRRAVAHVANCELTGERREVCIAEHLVDEAEVLAHHNRATVAHSDAGRFLTAVLQRLQAEIREPRDIAPRSPYAEDPALLVKGVGIGALEGGIID